MPKYNVYINDEKEATHVITEPNVNAAKINLIAMYISEGECAADEIQWLDGNRLIAIGDELLFREARDA
jgi:hypothetical protein